MVTYRHEAYLSRAIEGVLMQECDFPVELIIADDCSPDDTAEMVQAYRQNHPRGNRINYLRRETNMGMIPNFLDALQHCRGTYIALCDGDDYWTDARKLQKQVDFLENHPGFSAVCHNVRTVRGEVEAEPLWGDSERDITLHMLAAENTVSTLSVLFRAAVLQTFDGPALLGMPYGDYPLFLHCTRFGKIRYVPEIMGCYRIHDGGVWTSRRRNLPAELLLNQKQVDTYKTFMVEYPSVRRIFKKKLWIKLNAVRINYLEMGESRLSRKYAAEALGHIPLREPKTFFSLLVNLLFPSLLVRRIKNAKVLPDSPAPLP